MTEMKRTFLLLYLLITYFPFTFGQYIVSIEGGDPLSNRQIDTLSHYSIQIKYEMRFMPDTLERENYNRRTTVLNLSPEGISNYCEYSLFKRDSITSLHIENGKIRLSVINKAIKYGGRVHDNYYIIKSWPEKDKLFFKGQAGIDGNFKYTEDMPDFGWEIDLTQTKEVAGYTCYSAKGNYAGRDYQAWFTTDIPINDGPWKFQGLPGLILEVTSLDDEYIYTCLSIKNTEGAMILSGVDAAMKTSRENFMKILKRNKVDPASGITTMVDAGKLQTTMNLKNRKPRAYNPQEKY